MPDGRQASLMRRFAGACRFVFNKALALQQDNHANGGKYISYFDMSKHLTTWRNSPETPWLKDAHVHPLQQALKDLDRAYLLQSKRRRVLFFMNGLTAMVFAMRRASPPSAMALFWRR